MSHNTCPFDADLQPLVDEILTDIATGNHEFEAWFKSQPQLHGDAAFTGIVMGLVKIAAAHQRMPVTELLKIVGPQYGLRIDIDLTPQSTSVH